MTEITGYTMEEINTSGWYQTVYPDPEVQARAKARMDRMRRGDNLDQEEWEITRKDGQKRQLLISTRIVPGGETGVNVLAVMHDISERKKSEEETRRRADELAALNALARRVSATLSFEQVSDAALKGVMNAVQADLAFFFIRDGEKLLLKGAESTQPGEWLEAIPERRVGEYLCGLAARERKPIYSRDIFRDDRCTRDECKKAGFRSFAALPLLAGTEVIGIVGLSSREERDFQAQADFMETLASHVAVALENARLFEKVQNELTHRRRAEEALRRSEARLLATLENTPNVAIQWYDEAGQVQYWNKASEILYGWTADEAVGKTLDALILTPEGAAEFLRILNSIKETGKPFGPYEASVHRRDGSPGWVLSTTFGIPTDQGRTTFVCMDVDVTERRRGEAALRSSEEKYRSLVESSMDAILLLDTERRIVSVNQTFCQLFGYERDEIVGKSVRNIHPSEESFRSFGEQAYPIVKRQGYFRGEWELARKDGSRVPVETVTSAIRTPEGSISGYVSMIRDITERRKAEQERASLQDQLRQAQKIEAIGRLAGGIAHDFNNLLTVIKGTCQVSLLDLHERDPLYGNLKEIERSADRAADLTRQLLAFGRKQIMEMQVLDLNDIVRGLDSMLHRLLGEDIDLVTILPEGIGRVKVDPGQIEQVIINLAVNSRDAMPRGGKLTIETADVELDGAYARRHMGVQPGRHVMLSVSDTGVGMSAEVKDRLFEPFFTTKEMGKGTGLGLSTVYGILKQSGGNIWVYSEPGQGTTFKIYLPRVDEPLAEKREEIIGDIPRGEETILVVEDEETVRKLAMRLLKGQGYKVLEAPDGGKAFLLCEKYKERIDLVLTDVVMPGMSGRELVERLTHIHPEMKVIYMSGYTDNAIVHHGVLYQGIDFLQKPFTLDVLARKVREVLDR